MFEPIFMAIPKKVEGFQKTVLVLDKFPVLGYKSIRQHLWIIFVEIFVFKKNSFCTFLISTIVQNSEKNFLATGLDSTGKNTSDVVLWPSKNFLRYDNTRFFTNYDLINRLYEPRPYKPPPPTTTLFDGAIDMISNLV